MSVRRGMNQVVDDVVARATGRPTGGAPQLGVAADQDGHVHGPRERRIGRNVGSDTDPLQD